MARTHDMDRKHMLEMFRRAHEHEGAAFVEIYQNCNVFNDGAFEGITAKDTRAEMLIELHDGEPIRFGDNGRARRACSTRTASARSSNVADVGEDTLLVHDESRHAPALAFALSRLATHPTMPTPIGVFRDVVATDLRGRGAAPDRRRGRAPGSGRPRGAAVVRRHWDVN